MVDKRLSLKEAIAEYVRDDLSVAIERRWRSNDPIFCRVASVLPSNLDAMS